MTIIDYLVNPAYTDLKELENVLRDWIAICLFGFLIEVVIFDVVIMAFENTRIKNIIAYVGVGICIATVTVSIALPVCCVKIAKIATAHQYIVECNMTNAEYLERLHERSIFIISFSGDRFIISTSEEILTECGVITIDK